MKITYCYNSGFLVEDHDRLLVFDYITGSGMKAFETQEFLNGFEKVYVFASHAHYDHFDPVVLAWSDRHPRVTYIFSEDIRSRVVRKTSSNMVFLASGGTWADDEICVTAYGSTDKGVSFHVKTADVSLFHAGDLNDWHWRAESTQQEVDEMHKAFISILDQISQGAGRLDIAMFPVDPRMGQDFAEGADAFIERMSPRLFIPMHFRHDTWAVDSFISRHPERAEAIWRIQSAGQSLDYEI